MGAVTVIDERKNFRTFKFSLLAEHGCTSDLLYRLQYAHEKIPFLLAQLDPSTPAKWNIVGQLRPTTSSIWQMSLINRGS